MAGLQNVREDHQKHFACRRTAGEASEASESSAAVKACKNVADVSWLDSPYEGRMHTDKSKQKVSLMPTAIIRPLRCSVPLLETYNSLWAKYGNTRVFLLVQACFRLLRKSSPDWLGILQREIQTDILRRLATVLFASIWPIIDPIANLNKMLCYEFQIAGRTNEYHWTTRWLSHRDRTGREHNQVSVLTGIKTASTMDSSSESPEVASIRKGLGYKGVVPHSDEPQWFVYKGGLFRVYKKRINLQPENGPPLPPSADKFKSELCVWLYATSRSPFFYWLADSKRAYESSIRPVVPIHHFSTDGWKYPLFRTKRRLEDIVMTSANREKLRHLVEDFGRSSKWYLDRGLCWQKGILLHGPPGCGKTSTIVALASEYDLRIFKLSLNHPLLTDNLLRKFIGNAHQKAIVYLEDVDVWAKGHNRRLAEKAKRAEQPEMAAKKSPAPRTVPIDAIQPPEPALQHTKRDQASTGAQLSPPPESGLTLAGLLSVLDGVDEQKGLMFVLTSNDPSSLDSALIRPGRVDAYIEFTRATRQQAEELFNTFYKPRDEEQPDYDLDKVSSWAKAFAVCVDDCEFSPASLQAFLLEYRLDPAGAAAAMPDWVHKERTSDPSTLHPFVGPLREYTSLERKTKEAEPVHPSAALR